MRLIPFCGAGIGLIGMRLIPFCGAGIGLIGMRLIPFCGAGIGLIGMRLITFCGAGLGLQNMPKCLVNIHYCKREIYIYIYIYMNLGMRSKKSGNAERQFSTCKERRKFFSGARGLKTSSIGGNQLQQLLWRSER